LHPLTTPAIPRHYPGTTLDPPWYHRTVRHPAKHGPPTAPDPRSHPPTASTPLMATRFNVGCSALGANAAPAQATCHSRQNSSHSSRSSDTTTPRGTSRRSSGCWTVPARRGHPLP
jgi:hypothetical protein